MIFGMGMQQNKMRELFRRRSRFVSYKANEVTRALQREGGRHVTGMRFGMGTQQNKMRELFRKAANSKFSPYMYRDDRRRSRFVICKANEVTRALQREGGIWYRNEIWNGNAAEQNEGRRKTKKMTLAVGPNESDN
ncbi:hypothetical protein CDAR_545191 [Caerostris darwini]|uniref:Uncharacterized protein n=1 Tax=Caerostris darwini TaxID=1538125 RepID=A0AAV4TJL0_9ARAC|nr:hypothetical protein CDAR_545191 [Caerostris darwini]